MSKASSRADDPAQIKSENPHCTRLTQANVKRLPAPAVPTTWWDAALPGFSVRAMPNGDKSYCLQGNTRSGRCFKLVIGQANILSTEVAREEAKRILASSLLTADPPSRPPERA
jgi:hypothetical protein